MTPAYDLELLRVALEQTIAAAGDVYAHSPPDWICHRLTHIVGECQSLHEVLAQHGEEGGGGDGSE